MPRKSTPSAASKEAAASSKVEKADQDTPRRSGRAAAKVESSPSREAGRSRRSSTAAQTAASVAESRVTRSRTSVGTRKTSSSPSESSSSKSGKETGLESPASRVRSSRRSTGRVNYKESDGEEESRTRKKLLDDDADDDFNESEGEEESTKGSNKRKAPNSASKATPVKGKAKSERVSNRRQSKNKNVEDKDEKDTPGRKRKESESIDETSSSSSTRRSTRVRQSSGTPSNKGSRRSSRGSTSQPAATQKKRSSRGKSEPDADEDAGVDEGEDLMDAQETEESHSQESTAEETKTSDENLKKRKVDSDPEETAESEQKRIKLDTKIEDAGETSSIDETQPKDGTEDGIEKSSVDDKIEDKEESDSASDKKVVLPESNKDSVDEIKDDVSSVEKEQSDEEPMEVDQMDATPAVVDAPVSGEKQKSSEVSVVDKPVLSKPEELKIPLPSVEPPASGGSKGEECIEENVEPKEVPSPKDSEPEPKKKEELPKGKEEEVIDIASGSENEGESLPAEKGTTKAEMSPTVHDVDNSEESSSPTPIPSSECVEKVPHVIDKIEDVDLDSPTPSGDATASADKDTDKNVEILSGDRHTVSSESSQSSSDRGNAVPDSKENVEYVNIQEDTNKSDSDVNCLESPENTNAADTENSSNAFLSLEQDKESSLNGVHSNSEDSIKSIEIVGDGVSAPFPGGKESRVEEHPVPKANGAHDGIHDDGAAQDQSVLVSSSRRYVFNSSLKEDVLSLLKDKTFEFASYNLGCIVEDGSSQKDELISELNKLKADVICLQEVTKHFYQDVLEPRLDALGYNGILSVPEENSPGIASFHKSTVFRLAKHSEASLQKLIEKDLEASSLESADKAAVHSYLKKCGNVLFTQYSSIKGENTLTVANVSMPSSDISTHALQMSCLARELVTVIEGASKPLLLCGTFNMLEGEAPYQLLRDGYLSNDMIEELQRKKDVILPGKENAALVNLLWKAFQHPSSNLCSCYASVLGRELSIPGGSKPTSPDLLWFSSDCLHTVGVLDVAPSSREGPKDHHVALKATVAFSN